MLLFNVPQYTIKNKNMRISGYMVHCVMWDRCMVRSRRDLISNTNFIADLSSWTSHSLMHNLTRTHLKCVVTPTYPPHALHEKRFQRTVPSQSWEMVGNSNIYFHIFWNKFITTRVKFCWVMSLKNIPVWRKASDTGMSTVICIRVTIVDIDLYS